LDQFGAQEFAQADGEVFEVLEGRPPGQAVGAVGVVEEILGGGVDGGAQLIHDFGCVLRSHVVVRSVLESRPGANFLAVF
jgi:hypothetical protein